MGTAGCAEYAPLRDKQSTDSLVYICVPHAAGVSSEGDPVVFEGRTARSSHPSLSHSCRGERTRLRMFFCMCFDDSTRERSPSFDAADPVDSGGGTAKLRGHDGMGVASPETLRTCTSDPPC